MISNPFTVDEGVFFYAIISPELIRVISLTYEKEQKILYIYFKNNKIRDFKNKKEGEVHEKTKKSWGVAIDRYARFEPDEHSGYSGSGK